MDRNKIRIITGVGLLLIGISTLAAAVYGKGNITVWSASGISSIFGSDEADHVAGKAMAIYDDSGNLISLACRNVAKGDSIIKADGKSYEVVKVSADRATARYKGVDKDLLAYDEYFSKQEVPAMTVAQKENNRVGIYHTHSAESYVPSDGSESKPFNGGIYQVGQTLVNKLRQERINVVYDKSPHDPHDNNAYQRSRVTATNLMKKGPVALVDVHRDGIPDPNYYSKNISNEDVAQLRLVVGRQNPHMQANLDFARKMMAYTNKVHPNIVKEIFMARGNYNQDLMPTAILVEAGTHTNTKEQAERGIALFADGIPAVLGITTPGPGQTGAGAPESPGSWRSLAWILGIAVVGGGAFLLISSGGLDKAKARMSSFMGREFTGFLGPRRSKNKDLLGKKDPDKGDQ